MTAKNTLSPDQEAAFLEQARAGSEEAMVALEHRYERMIAVLAFRVCYRFAWPVVSEQELRQEGMRVLRRAVCAYDSRREAQFSTYLYSSAHNAMCRAAAEAAKRAAHEQPGDLIPFTVTESAADPEAVVLQQEEERRLEKKLRRILSELEFDVLSDFLDKYTYEQIAEKRNITVKAVDNAMSRVRRKLKKELRP